MDRGLKEREHYERESGIEMDQFMDQFEERSECINSEEIEF